MAKQSARDCQEFDVGPFVEFTGAVNFSTFSQVNLATSTPADRIKECKAKCINDAKCGIWSVDGSKCNMYTVDASVSANTNGLVVNPNYMYNSGLPNLNYATIRGLSMTNTAQCKEACRTDPNCNFFEFGQGRSCNLNKTTSPHPTGFVKTYTCSFMECVKGRTYLGTTVQITFHPKNLTFEMIRISTSDCFPSVIYTISTDFRTITFDNPFVTGVDSSTFTNYTGSTIMFGNERLTYVPTRVHACSPLSVSGIVIPDYTDNCTSQGIFECVKGKEFGGPVAGVAGATGFNVKFTTTQGILFLGVCTGVFSNLPIVNVPYTIDENSASVTFTSRSASDTVLNVTILTTTSRSENSVYDYVSNNTWSLRGGYPLTLSTVGNTIRFTSRVSFTSSNGDIFNAPSNTSIPSPCTACYLVQNYTIVNNVIGFNWTKPENNVIYTFRFYNYVDEDPWKLSIIVKVNSNESSGTLTGGPTQPSKMVTGACSARCLPDSIEICTHKGTTINTNEGICSDGSVSECFSMCEYTDFSPVCDPPFRTFTKFANVNDFSQQIVIETMKNIIINGVRTFYFLRSGELPGEYFIDTPYCNFYYSFYTVNGKKVASLMKNAYNGNVDRYIDVAFYFYKKTLIKPVSGSTKKVRYDTTECDGSTTTQNEVDDSILYHCLMFSGISTLKYYILRKSTVTMLQNRNERDGITFEETIDQLLSPYENLTSNQIINGTWSINPTTDNLNIILDSNVPSTLLEEYGYVDLKRKDPIYTVKYTATEYAHSTGYTKVVEKLYENEIFYFAPDNQLINTIAIVFTDEKQKISQNDYEYLQITRKDSGISCLVKRHTYGPEFNYVFRNTYICKECDYSGNYLSSGGIFERDIMPVGSDVSIRFSFMRQRQIDQLSSNFNLSITDTGDAGDFFLYDSQLLSGLDGYNSCSTKALDTRSLSSVSCTSVYDAAFRCETIDNAVGFEYDFNTNIARILLFDDQFNISTNRDSIVNTHNDLSDTRIIYNSDEYVDLEPSEVEKTFTTERTDGYGTVVERTTILNLTHNIFPSDKISPITSDSTKPSILGSLGSRINPRFDVGLLSDIMYVPNDPSFYNRYESYHGFSRDPNELIYYDDNTIATTIDFKTKRMFIRSNQPNIGGKIFRGIHFKNTLPSQYTGIGGYDSTPVQITTTNDLELENGNIMNQFLIYRMTNYFKVVTTSTGTGTGTAGIVGGGGLGTVTGTIDLGGGGTTVTSTTVLDESVNLFLLGTSDGSRFINYKYKDVGIVDEDCYWYITSFPAYPRKLYLVSFVDSDIIIEFDLNSNFIFPGIQIPRTLELLFDFYDEKTISLQLGPDSLHGGEGGEGLNRVVLPTNSDPAYRSILNTCNIGGISCKYTYVGNRLIVYNDINCSDEKDILKVFNFYINPSGGFDLVDEDTKNIFTGSSQSSMEWCGPFMRVSKYVTLDNVVYENQYSILDALRDSAKEMFVPPAEQGNKDVLDNFAYALQFLPTGRGPTRGPAKTAAKTAAKESAKETTKLPRQITRLPPRKPDPDRGLPPSPLSDSRGTSSQNSFRLRDETTSIPPFRPIGTQGSSVTKPKSNTDISRITKTPLNMTKPPSTPTSLGSVPTGLGSSVGRQSLSNTPQNSQAIQQGLNISRAHAGTIPQSTADRTQNIVLRPVQQNANQYESGRNIFAGKSPSFIMRFWETQAKFSRSRNQIPPTNVNS